MAQIPSISTAAVIGCGKSVIGKVGWAQGHAHGQACLAAFPGVRLCGVDPNEENLAAFGTAFDLPESQLFRSTAELYATVKPEIASIATWPALHLPQVQEAEAAGVKMIVCEKPLALDESEVDRMIALAARPGVTVGVAHQRRYDPRFGLVREVVRQGLIGEKAVLTGRVGDNWDILSWTTHWFDMANFIFDAPPLSLLAGIDNQGERRYGHAVENASVVFAEYPEGRQALFVTGPDTYGGAGISVEGTKGCVRMTATGVIVMTPEGTREIAAPIDGHKGDYVALFLDLARAHAEGGRFRCDIREGAWATRMAYAAHASAMQQRQVTFPSRIKYAALEVAQHPPVPEERKKLRVVALADCHHWEDDLKRSGRDGLIGALHDLGHEVHLVKLEEREMTPVDFADKDLLVIYHTQRKSTEEVRRLLGGWILGGRPTLVSHCGIGAYDWDEYRSWIGRYWVWGDEDTVNASRHPLEPCDISVEPETTLWSAPWTRGWLPIDEIYLRLGAAGPVEDIAWATLQGERHPWAWRSGTVPNLAVFLPGHRADIWELPVMRTGLAAMIAVVA